MSNANGATEQQIRKCYAVARKAGFSQAQLDLLDFPSLSMEEASRFISKIEPDEPNKSLPQGNGKPVDKPALGMAFKLVYNDNKDFDLPATAVPKFSDRVINVYYLFKEIEAALSPGAASTRTK